MSMINKISAPLNFNYDELESIQDFIRWGASQFSQAELYFGHGSDNALDESFHLVCQVLHLPWNMAESYFNAKLTLLEREYIAKLVIRRIKERKPLAYLTNQAWFCERSYYVDERVLIPRSPISALIDNGFAPWLGDTSVLRIMDLCTGSGCIGIAAAYAFPDATVDLLDISDEALEVAQINIDRHHFWDRIETIQSDLFQKLLEADIESEPYQLIISNPPYVDNEDLSDMPEEFQHEPKLALRAGEDGLYFIHKILANAKQYIAEDGLLIIEVGNSAEALRATYPMIPFVWPELALGGHGVCILSGSDCYRYHHLFLERSLSKVDEGGDLDDDILRDFPPTCFYD